MPITASMTKPLISSTMHELSLAEHIFNTALKAEGVSAENLRVINVECGALSGVNVQSMEFCLRLMSERHNIEDITVNVAETPARLQCECGCYYNTPSLFRQCPECGSFEHTVRGGDEVLLESVEVKDG